MRYESLCFLLALALLPGAGMGASVAGIELPDAVRIKGLERPLLLNGAGVRKKFFIPVYVGGLYLAERQKGVGSLLSVPRANRVVMRFVYHEVSRRQLEEGWREGFANNLSAKALAVLQQRLERFVSLFDDLREGDTVWLDFVPGRGTEVTINNVARGTIAGDDFNLALLAVWLGDNPVTQALKNAMVGVDKD